MLIGIHHRKGSYSVGWIEYCKERKIPYKIVNAYRSDIIMQLNECDAFMWHYNHLSPKDVVFAKQLLFSIEQAGKLVYPNFNTGWHFDDKLGQKYLLEACFLPVIPSYVFFTEEEAMIWTENCNLPVVFKLRRGAGSCNVRLVKTRLDLRKVIKTAFGKGFRQVDPLNDVKDTFSKFLKHKKEFKDITKSLLHLYYPYQIEKTIGKERGYVYFQDFIPNCHFDIRVQLVGRRCYAMTRKVREKDFRASGGGNIDYDGSKVPLEAVRITFDVAKKLAMNTLAIDLLPYRGTFLIAEISYAFGIDEGELDFGYWDEYLVWHKGPINPYAWMVEEIQLKLEK